MTAPTPTHHTRTGHFKETSFDTQPEMEEAAEEEEGHGEEEE